MQPIIIVIIKVQFFMSLKRAGVSGQAIRIH